MKIEIEAKNYIFTATGYTVKFDGFTKLYEEKVDDEKNDSASPLPVLAEGDELKLKSILGNQHFTQPPARYTEASLTKALEENGDGFVKAMWCGNEECEDKVKEITGVGSRCIPFDQEEISDVCVCCGKPAKKMLYWGKAY